ncbi:dihydrofolate reductase family protein [Glutamicibacter sp. V16R2B1]|uniref:dihydrofolate reductase family protein n=1 Tax=Glutamicibacter sp. V16R2B1 TaxID=2036207 RepID=UPI0010FDE5BB|nr:dihydrofolate reductase family protein [Glutamicibacter sp. V16R2B1]TLK56346.1 dihydrofolate reductase [Glutamicibacter sp. V16R2B1]
MRQLVAVEFLSVDGVMQGLGSPDEDRSGGFVHGGWGARYAPAIHAALGAQGLEATTAYVFGRRTYEKMAAYWPFVGRDNPIAAHMNQTPKYVVSTRLRDPAWRHTEVIAAEVGEKVRRLKSEGQGEMVILGSGMLTRQLLAEDLIDSLRLFVHPLLLGAGKQLFGPLPAPRQLRLTGCQASELGSLILSYDVEPNH